MQERHRHGRRRAGPASCEPRRPHQPCHPRAISDGQSRSRADNHGHWRPADGL